mgnify:CR=1 FL=1
MLAELSGQTHRVLTAVAVQAGQGGQGAVAQRLQALSVSEVTFAPLTEAHILALVDAWPPALLPHLKRPAPGSTLTWTIEFVQPLLELSTLDWCKYCVTTEHARDGYGHAAAALWSAEGKLIALSRQTVTIFA